mgnify:CR=1 FL=1
MMFIIKSNVFEIYQPLFDYMSQEYNLTLTITEMDEIMIKCEEVQKLAIKYLNNQNNQ